MLGCTITTAHDLPTAYVSAYLRRYGAPVSGEAEQRSRDGKMEKARLRSHA